MGNPRRVDETETDFLVRRLRECKTPKDSGETIESALTFPAGGEPLQSKLDVQRIYNQSCILVDKFADLHEERWGFRWLPERPADNPDPMAGLREHRRWYNRVDKIVISELPCGFNPEKVDLSIKCFEELRDLLVKYPSRDPQQWEEARKRAGVPEKLSLMKSDYYGSRLLEEAKECPDETGRSGLSMADSPLARQVRQARVAELEAALERRYTPEVDRCYRELDDRYAATVKRLAEEMEGLWKYHILSIWDRQEPIGLYDDLTGKTISGPMERLGYAASEIADGRMANPGHRAETRKNCETLIALFTGFREKIRQAQSDKAKSSEETTSPQSGTPKGQPSVNAGAHMNVTIQNSNNVAVGGIQQAQNLTAGKRSSIGKKAPTSQKNKKNIKRTITASVLFLAALLTVLQILFGWMGGIWRFLTGE